MSLQDAIELSVVVGITAAIIAFAIWTTTIFPAIYDVRDYPELDLEVTLE